MVDLSKLRGKKGKSRFGEIHAIKTEENILEAPEVAPAQNRKKSRKKTGRTVPFSTRVTKAFFQDFRVTAFEQGLKKVELLEEALVAYKEKHNL